MRSVAWMLAGLLFGITGVAEAQTAGEAGIARIEQPMEQLHRARQSVVRGEFEAAAAEIRDTASSLTVEAGRATEPARTALEDTAASFRSLAGEVERGAVTSVDRVDRAFARTDLALVTVCAAVAAEAWARQETVDAGRALDDAVSQLEEAAGRTGELLDDATAAALGRARWFAGRLIRDGATVPGDFRQAYEAVVAALDSLGRCLATGMAASPLGPAGPRAPRPDAGPATPPAPSC